QPATPAERQTTTANQQRNDITADGGFLDMLGWQYGQDARERGVNGGISFQDFDPTGPSLPNATVHTGLWNSERKPDLGIRSLISGETYADIYGAMVEANLFKFEQKPRIPGSVTVDSPPNPYGIYFVEDKASSLTLGFDLSANAAAGVAISNDM